MKVSKETRQLARGLVRASFTDTQLDKGRISSVVQSLIAKKPRNYIKVLEDYKRLLRLELEKRRARMKARATGIGHAFENCRELKKEIRQRPHHDL